MKFTVWGILWMMIFVYSGKAQNYHAIEGSSFAGSLGVANNPASIVNTPYPWDLTVLSLQLKNSTNAATIYNFSLISPSDSSKYGFNGGNASRYASFNFNIRLLNARIALNRRQSIAFGANIRGYGIGKTSRFNYNDTLPDINDFFRINNGNLPFSGNVVSSSWLELFATYAQTIRDDEAGRLNAGVTLKAMRGISGGFVQLNGGSVRSTLFGGQPVYTLSGGVARYGYSSNYDLWLKSNSTGQNIKDFLLASRAGLALDLGAEYEVKNQAVRYYTDNEEDDYFDYEWKIGVSLLDVGQNVFKYGTQSRLASDPKIGVADSNLDAKFDNGIQNVAQFNDSLSTVVNNFGLLAGNFTIRNPVRLVVNVDRPVQDHFSVNANLSLNLTGSNRSKTLSVQEMNLLILTPRWETRRWGFYLPIQVTTQGKCWIGGAFKAGPLLLGVHNWANVFSKNSMQNGGGYIAFVIRPGHGFRIREDKQYDCPKESR